MLQTMNLEDQSHRCYWNDRILLHLHLDMSPTAVRVLTSISANVGTTHLQAHIYALQLVYDHGLRKLASWLSGRGRLNNPKSDSCKPKCKWWLSFLVNYKNSGQLTLQLLASELAELWTHRDLSWSNAETLSAPTATIRPIPATFVLRQPGYCSSKAKLRSLLLTRSSHARL